MFYFLITDSSAAESRVKTQQSQEERELWE